MKSILTIISFLLFTASAGFGQDARNGSKSGKIEALKIAFLTQKLNLSPSEAQKFWPVYNNYSAEIKRARMEQRQNKVAELEAEDKILNIRKKYSAEFSEVISADKVNTFFRSEKDFGNYIQKELMERRQLRQQQKSSQ